LQEKLKWATEQREAGHSTLPSTIEGEKKWNVFLRLQSPEIISFLGVGPEFESAEVMSRLREAKDHWKAH
jgi:hydroxyacylglutathione hydrolase